MFPGRDRDGGVVSETVTLAQPEGWHDMFPETATIVVCPVPFACANPLESTLATDALVLVQNTDGVEPPCGVMSPNGGVLSASMADTPDGLRAVVPPLT